MESFLETIISRRSVKDYLPELPPIELINKIITAGTYAPSGKNKQSAIIVAITNKEIRNKMSKLCAKVRNLENFDPFYNAPVCLIVLADKNCFTGVYDGSVVMENMLLAAHSLNLGACWIHWAKQMFETQEGKEFLNSIGVQGEYEGIGTCIVGYPKTKPTTPLSRKENYVYFVK